MNCIQVKYPLNLYSQCSFVLCDIVENAQVAEGAFWKGPWLTKQCKICILCNKHKCLLFDVVWLVWNEKVAFNVRKCILFHCSPVLFQNTEQQIILFTKFISVFSSDDPEHVSGAVQGERFDWCSIIFDDQKLIGRFRWIDSIIELFYWLHLDNVFARVVSII